MTSTNPDLRYPVGRFTRPKTLTPKERKAAIRAIAGAPSALRAAVTGLTDAQLDTPYRPDGWTVRQVVHHVPDSHMNAYTRFKLALTEDVPTIKPYDEAKWAELDDSKSKLVEHSLTLLEALHARWVFLLERLKPADFERKLNHPEWDAPMTLDMLLALYAWHGRHHVAHITELRKRSGW
ncbi:MAG: bacillithiol transferase BstA [Gemmatimonadaceae bacterium]